MIPRYNIAVRNKSERLTDLEVARMTAAVAHQVRYDFQPIWGRDILVEYDATPDRYDWVFDIVDQLSSGPATAAGWHTIVDGQVRSEISTTSGLRPSIVLSHEVLEAAANDSVNRFAYNWNDNHFYAMEVCDPVQRRSYRIGDFYVSDFVTPDWFSTAKGISSAAFKTRLAPFRLATGGYAVRYDQGFNDRTIGLASVPVGHARAEFLTGGFDFGE